MANHGHGWCGDFAADLHRMGAVMTTNATGWEIEVLADEGWVMEYDEFDTRAEAEEMLKLIPSDGFSRRVYETLET